MRATFSLVPRALGAAAPPGGQLGVDAELAQPAQIGEILLEHRQRALDVQHGPVTGHDVRGALRERPQTLERREVGVSGASGEGGASPKRAAAACSERGISTER